jgi:hypothetical protein
MPDKTGLLEKINVPDKYFFDFLRGHLDGDGSVFTYKDRYMQYKGKRYSYNRLYTSFISLSPNHIRWMRLKINKLLNIKGALTSYLKENRKLPIWQLRFAKKESLILLNRIYYTPNLPCLIRKRKIAERFIN